MSKSDRPFELEPSVIKELVSLGLDAFDDPAEITSTTGRAAKAIIEDQRANRGDNDSKSMLAILAILVKIRREQRNQARLQRMYVFAVAVLGVALYTLDKLGVIAFVHH